MFQGHGSLADTSLELSSSYKKGPLTTLSTYRLFGPPWMMTFSPRNLPTQNWANYSPLRTTIHHFNSSGCNSEEDILLGETQTRQRANFCFIYSFCKLLSISKPRTARTVFLEVELGNAKRKVLDNDLELNLMNGRKVNYLFPQWDRGFQKPQHFDSLTQPLLDNIQI